MNNEAEESMALDDAAKKKARNRGFTILLVEDDPPLRAVLKSILEIQSFNVLETDSKVGAMAILGDDENTIHVMIPGPWAPTQSSYHRGRTGCHCADHVRYACHQNYRVNRPG